MPRITVEMLPGRSDEQKLLLTSELINVTARALGIPKKRVIVELRDAQAPAGKPMQGGAPKKSSI